VKDIFNQNLSHLAFFAKISKVILNFLTPEFALEISKFQNFEYEVYQSSPKDG
jgi:hypothetical protein